MAALAIADFWVFGYGSLMWDPGFRFEEAAPALLRGYHRSLCVYSYRYRGSRERPGLVFGLDRGGACRGIAFHIAAVEADAVRAYLWEREMPTGAYQARDVQVTLADGRAVTAIAFAVDRSHHQYTGQLGLDRVVEMVAGASGIRGENRAYLARTIAHLRALGLPDRRLEELARRVEAHGTAPVASS